MSRTPLSTTQSNKKRELPSPEFLIDTKKNRISASVSEAESESEESENMSSPTVHDAANYTNITLQESDLQKMAGIIQDSFQPRLAQQIQESLKFQVSDLVKSIVEGVLEGLQSKVKTLESENAELRQKIQQLEAKTDLAEQYSHRNCLRISGVPETADENTDDYICDFAHALDVDLTINDIDRSHRVGKPVTGFRNKPRDIIVKFVSYRMRAKFYKARVLRNTRGYKGVFINEDLTKSRSLLMYEARRRVKSKQLKSAWSSDGSILVRLNDGDPTSSFGGTVKRIISIDDLPPINL